MYKLTGRVATSHSDANGRMKLVSAMDIIQDCSILWMESEEVFSRYLTENNLGMFLASRQADIIRLPIYGERIYAVTGIYRCNGYYGQRNTVLFGEDDAPCIKSWTIGAFVKRDINKMAKIPKATVDSLVIDPPVDMEYLDRKIDTEGLDFCSLPKAPVRRNDIDYNGHVNNVRYLEAALEYIPEHDKIMRLRIEYKAQAWPGDIFYPLQAQQGSCTYISLCNEKEEPYTVMEFKKV